MKQSVKNRAVILIVLYLNAVYLPCRAVSAGDSPGLKPEEQRTLLRLARATITMYLEAARLPDMTRYNITPALQQPCGVFVTLKEKATGDLRGCIGYIRSRRPLAESVVECAVFAATRDRRFSPLKKGEQNSVLIEISVLSPPRKIDTVEEIAVGSHGLIVSKGVSSGVLLPQVPVELGWNRSDFVKAACRKAGLPGNAWQHGAVLQVFTAQVFKEPSSAASKQKQHMP